ncbi:MAG TPA: Gfo/Idh/MocA family oxidoreductase [Burkholderiaceae bacterium]|nr:Gfo/Idh/MocA family oxidoreductase [Burkholderiaceae bacterium]
MKRFGMAVIGLGVVGRRMLEQAAASPGIRVASAWDASPAVRAAAAADVPGLPLAGGVADAIERLDVDVVYVAVPPLGHAALVRAALAAGKAVFCEKPLGVDVAESEALVAEVERSGLPQAINFPFASSAAVGLLGDAIAAPSFGLRAIEVRVRFAQWPRAWQAGAAWLQRADQGGFTREVLSHFVWLLLRLRGEAALRGTAAAWPARPAGAAEHAVAAALDCDGVPATVSGSVGGGAPDRIEARFVGAASELVLADWYRLEAIDAESPQGRPVPGLPADPRAAAYQRQLAQLHAMLSGDAHTLPGFAEALAVQRRIESMLTSRRDE